MKGNFMKKTVYTFAIICLTILLSLSQSFLSVNAASKTLMHPPTSAQAMCVLEGNTNTVIYCKNEEKTLPMASTTKIITGILAIESVKDLDEMVAVNDQAVGIEGTSIYLQKGERLSVRELLYGLILASGNDAAMALALHVSPTTEEFVDKMNEFAKSVGAENTHFDNPHGLDSKTHYTTAKDLALMTSYALKNAEFKEIVSTKFKQIPGTEKSGERYLRNKNKLLWIQENNVGVKTGFTDNAGRCLVNAVEQDGMQLITVVLNCGPMFEEAKALTQNAVSEYKMKEFVTPYNYVGTVPVENGEKNEVNIVSIKGFKLPIKMIDEEKYVVKYELPDMLEAPVEKDAIIGEIKVYYEEELVFSDSLYSLDEIKNVNIKFMLNHILQNWF